MLGHVRKPAKSAGCTALAVWEQPQVKLRYCTVWQSASCEATAGATQNAPPVRGGSPATRGQGSHLAT